MDIQQILFSVLRCEFFNEPLSITHLSHQTFVQLKQLAARQTVEGFLAGVLMRANVQLEKQDALMMFSSYKHIEKLNYKVNEAVIALEKLLGSAGVSHIVFKGQTLSPLYPHPFERMPGDIDFYCNAVDFQKAVALFSDKWGVSVKMTESEQHGEFSYNDVPFEMHFCMIKFNNNSIQRYWEHLLATQARSRILVDGVAVTTLNPTLNVLYTFLHLYHHLVELGVGLRQFCDVLCLLHRYKDQIDKQALTEHLEQMGFKHAFCAIGWILVSRLGLPQSEFPLEISKKEQSYEQAILHIVFKGGNFGKYMSDTAVRSGMKYNVEAAMRKFSHYYLFWNLSRKEIIATILKEIPQKIFRLSKK